MMGSPDGMGPQSVQLGPTQSEINIAAASVRGAFVGYLGHDSKSRVTFRQMKRGELEAIVLAALLKARTLDMRGEEYK